MLTDEVRNFLSGIVPDQLIDVYERFITFLSEKEVFTSYYYILELIATKDTYEKPSLALRLNDILASQVDAILIDFDVELSDEITIPESLQFLEAFFLIEHWDDQDRLQALINSAETTEIALADIIAEISAIPSGTVLPWIKRVSPKFIDNISNLTKREDDSTYVELLPDDYEHYEKTKAKLKSYIAEKKEEINIVEFISESGLRILTPIEELITYYITSTFVDIEQFNNIDNPLLMRKKEINTLSDNLIGLGLMSGSRSEEFLSVMSKTLTSIALPERVVTELLAQLRDKTRRLDYNG